MILPFAPKTWSTNEFSTAAMLNQQIRDNITAIAEELDFRYGIQSANLAKNNNATLEDMADLFIPIGANETLIWLAFVQSTSGNTGAGLKFTVTAPAGTTGIIGLSGPGNTSPGGSPTYGADLVSAIPNTQRQLSILTGLAIASSTAGNLQVQGAQNVATGANTTFHLNSIIFGKRLL